MRVKLTKKLAAVLDGIDLQRYVVGDVLNLSRHDARLLVAEGWAVPEQPVPRRRSASARPPKPQRVPVKTC